MNISHVHALDIIRSLSDAESESELQKRAVYVIHYRFATLKMPGRLQKEYPNCKDIPVRCNKCKHCSVELVKKRGRPVGTMKEAGYLVSTNGGRPRKMPVNDGGSYIQTG